MNRIRDLSEKHLKRHSSILWVIMLVILVFQVVLVGVAAVRDETEGIEEHLSLLMMTLLYMVFILGLRDLYWPLSRRGYVSDTDQVTLSISDQRSVESDLREEVHALVSAITLGLDLATAPLTRIVPVRVYLREENWSLEAKLSEAIDRLLSRIGFEFADDFPPERGSWFKRWFARSKELLTREEVQQRLAKAERALELATLQIKQSEVDKNQAEAAGTLLQALNEVPSAVCQIGSILVIKVKDGDGASKVFTRSLTAEEMMYLEHNQELLRSPERILECISEANRKKELLASGG